MSQGILMFADLQRMCRPNGPAPRPATVRRWAEREGIRYKYDRHGGIWTTREAVNASLGLLDQPAEAEKPEDLI